MNFDILCKMAPCFGKTTLYFAYLRWKKLYGKSSTEKVDMTKFLVSSKAKSQLNRVFAGFRFR
jgi:hypothetical protein